jgi:hypothetical protein
VLERHEGTEAYFALLLNQLGHFCQVLFYQLSPDSLEMEKIRTTALKKKYQIEG